MYKNVSIEVDINEFEDDDIIDAVWNRDLAYVFERDRDISDYNDETLLGAMKYRGLSLIEEDTQREIERIVQNHRCGLPWQDSALELLYNLSNKIV